MVTVFESDDEESLPIAVVFIVVLTSVIDVLTEIIIVLVALAPTGRAPMVLFKVPEVSVNSDGKVQASQTPDASDVPIF